MRQEEAAKLAAECDAMVVIGGKHSANSVHLSVICSEVCPNVQFIENAGELDMDRLKSADTVGITAGASTPAWIIKEVSNTMSEEIKTDAIPAEEKEMSFDEMLEESIKTIYNGDKVTGYVVAITGTEVSVDIGTKYSGFIPTTEFTDDGIKVEDAVKVGDTIEAVVVRVNDVEGTVMLSKKRLDAAKSWTMVEEAVESGEFLEGTVTEINKGGVVVNVKGVRVFVPASQSGLPKEADMNQLLKQKVRVKITEVNRSRKRVVGSIRAVAQKERREKAEAIWNEMEVGNKYHGVVKSMTSYGAFVDIGGIDGMVHVSEMSWSRIKNPAEVFNIGDEVDVYVISFDKEKKKISLGYKDPNENPWVKFTTKYNVGDTAEVKIVKLMTFGAFAEVLPGVDGLIHEMEVGNKYHGVVKSMTSYGAFVDIGGIDGMVHVSEMSWSRIKNPAEVFNIGDEVDVYVISFDKEKKKISLGYKDPNENPWVKFTTKYNVGDTAEVKIVKLMTFGAFAEVLPGVDGLIHISQIANRRIGKPEEVLSVGDVVEAKITAIDTENHKISLSIRALAEPAAAEVEEAPEVEDNGEDALVYEVSTNGEAKGEIVEE